MPIVALLLSLLASSASTPDVTCKQGQRCAVRYLFQGIVDSDTVPPAIEFIRAANDAGADEIIFEINTPGGSVPAGFGLAKAIEESDVPVTCIVDGAAESMGAFILQSCDTRMLTRRSVLMFHEPALSYSVEHGQPNEWRSLAEMMEAEREIIAEHCQHRLKVSMAEYRRRTDGTLMWFMTWRDALKFGAVDGVVSSVKSEFKRAQKRAR